MFVSELKKAALIACVFVAATAAQAQQTTHTAIADSVTATTNRITSDVAPAVTSTAVTTSGGTKGLVPVFTGTSTIDNTLLYYNTGGLGIGRFPAAPLDVLGKSIFRGAQVLSRSGDATSSVGAPSFGLIMQSSVFNSNNGGALLPYFQLQTEPVGNNTTSTSATFNFLYYSGVGSTPSETGLYFNPNGTIHFAPSQTFPITTGATGPQGPQGPAGPAGPTGPQGPAGLNTLQLFTSTTLLQTFVTNTDQYGPVMGLANGLSGSDYYAQSRASLIFPKACTASNLKVNLNYESLTSPFVMTTTVTVNGSNTPLTCASGFATGYGFSCTSSGTYAIPAGALVALDFSHTGTNPANVFPQVTWQCE